MDPIYGRMTGTASRLLANYNQAEYVLTRTGAPVVDPEAPWEEPTPGPDQSWPLQGIGKAKTVQYVDGNGVIHNANEMLFAVFADEPKPGDTLTCNGLPLTVLDVAPVTDAVVAWKFTVKA